MLTLEQLYRQSQIIEMQQLAIDGVPAPPRDQDEDVDTDEDLMFRNTKDCIADLKKSIMDFLAGSNK